MRLVRCLLLAPLLATACGGTAAESPPAPDTRVVFYDSDPEVAARVLVDGVPVEIRPPAKNELSWYSRQTSSGGSIYSYLLINADGIPPEELEFDNGYRLWLFGRRLRVAGGELFVGDRGYGPVGTADEVRIDAEGVHVNGVLRGGVGADRPDGVTGD